MLVHNTMANKMAMISEVIGNLTSVSLLLWDLVGSIPVEAAMNSEHVRVDKGARSVEAISFGWAGATTS